MTKNKTGGNKWKKRKSVPLDGKIIHRKNPQIEEYGIITKNLGDRRFIVIDSNKKEYIGHVIGKLRKRCWICTNDLVIFSYRDFQGVKLILFTNIQTHKPVKLKN